jgi:predicted transcriptional regulator of viral defense system
MYRINELVGTKQYLFHTNDLAIIWGLDNSNTLYKTISRYLEKGRLFQVYKGLYSTIPISELDPLDLGPAIIHGYTYLSTESVLSIAGVISQAIYDHTYVASVSKRISVGKWSFRYRQMKPEFLYNPEGIEHQNDRLIASVERAIADLLYYDPHYHFDIPDIIDFEKVRDIQEKVGYGRG